jgi:hypothetical protein
MDMLFSEEKFHSQKINQRSRILTCIVLDLDPRQTIKPGHGMICSYYLNGILVYHYQTQCKSVLVAGRAARRPHQLYIQQAVQRAGAASIAQPPPRQCRADECVAAFSHVYIMFSMEITPNKVTFVVEARPRKDLHPSSHAIPHTCVPSPMYAHRREEDNDNSNDEWDVLTLQPP